MANKKQLIPIIAVIAIGVLLGGLILTSHKTAPSNAAGENPQSQTGAESAIGPKGGKLLTKDGFGVEVTIFEKGVPPQFRLYLYENGKPLAPSSAKVTVTLSRLGKPAQVYRFKPEADYLIGDGVVEEPHSFDVAVAAEWKSKTFQWNYSHAEARVEIPDAMLKNMDIEIRTAGPETIRPMLKLPGEIIYNEHTVVMVVPRLPGIVAAVYRHHCEEVKKGEVLADIEVKMLADLGGQ